MDIHKKIGITLFFLLQTTDSIAAAVPPSQSNLLTQQSAQIIGESTIAAVGIYLKDKKQPVGFFSFIESFEIPDEAIKTALSFVIDAIKKDDAFMATQMLGQMLNDLNATYGTAFNTNDIITKIQQQPTSPAAVATATSPAEKTPQTWMNTVWEKIQYYINRGYQMGQDLIAAVKKRWNK